MHSTPPSSRCRDSIPPASPSRPPAPSRTSLLPLPPHPLVQPGDTVCCRAHPPSGIGTLQSAVSILSTQRRRQLSVGRRHAVPWPAVPPRRFLRHPTHSAFLRTDQRPLVPLPPHPVVQPGDWVCCRAALRWGRESGSASPRWPVHDDGHSWRRGGGTQRCSRLSRHDPCSATPSTSPSNPPTTAPFHLPCTTPSSSTCPAWGRGLLPSPSYRAPGDRFGALLST